VTVPPPVSVAITVAPVQLVQTVVEPETTLMLTEIGSSAVNGRVFVAVQASIVASS
jgi:hypothetical protein